MPSRRLPQTDDDRSAAMNVAFGKYNITAIGDRLITDAQFTTLDAQRTAWNTARTALGPLLNAQTSATGLVDSNLRALRMVISHFIQVFNLGVARGTYPAEARAFYLLDVSSDKVPSLSSSSDVDMWAQRLVDGEAERIATGAPAMTNPAIAEVSSLKGNTAGFESSQSVAKDAYDSGQEAVSGQRPAVDALILDLWDTIEYNLRADDPSSLRRKAREWGVVYLGDTAPPVPPPAPAGQPAPPPP